MATQTSRPSSALLEPPSKGVELEDAGAVDPGNALISFEHLAIEIGIGNGF